MTRPAGRIGDRAISPREEHACPDCPDDAKGPSTSASSTVLINGRGALRDGDVGTHEDCHAPRSWMADAGAPRVLINDRHAHRLGDRSSHGGGEGRLVEGSPNVLIGDHMGPDGPHWFIVKCQRSSGQPARGATVHIEAPDGQTLTEASNGKVGHHLRNIAVKGEAKVRITIQRRRRGE